MGELTYQEKVQRDIMKQVRHNRIPSRDGRVRPIYSVCGRCKKNKVTSHHFFCDKCHKDINIERKIKSIIKQGNISINDYEKISGKLYAEHKTYVSTFKVKEYVSDLIKRGILKGGDKKWEQS